MSYPPPPPPPGAPGGDPGNQPTQAFPPQGPPTGPQYGGYGPPPGATPPPGAPGGPGGPGYPPQPGGYAPQQPPKKGMSSGAIIGIVGVVLVALLLAGVGVFLVTRDGGDDDDRADRTEEDRDESTTTTEGGDDTTTTTEGGDDTTTTTEGGDDTTTTTQGGTSGGEDDLSMGGQTTASGYVAGDDSVFFSVTVPQGSSAVLTVTPDSDADIVVVVDGQRFDEALSGEPERINLTANTSAPFEIEVYEFWGNGAGYYIDLT